MPIEGKGGDDRDLTTRRDQRMDVHGAAMENFQPQGQTLASPSPRPAPRSTLLRRGARPTPGTVPAEDRARDEARGRDGEAGGWAGEAGTPTTARPWTEPSERAEDPGASAASGEKQKNGGAIITAGASAGERREERARRGGRDDGTSERSGAAATMTRTRVGRGAKQRRTEYDVLFVPADDDATILPRARPTRLPTVYSADRC